MAGLTKNGKKNLMFIQVPKQRKKSKVVLVMKRNCSDNSDNNNNSDNDKDNISDHDNNSNMKVT